MKQKNVNLKNERDYKDIIIYIVIYIVIFIVIYIYKPNYIMNNPTNKEIKWYNFLILYFFLCMVVTIIYDIIYNYNNVILSIILSIAEANNTPQMQLHPSKK